MKILNVMVITIICLFQSNYSRAYTPPEAKVTAVVVDEDGHPMEGIDIVIGFDMGGKVRGTTDSKGTFSASKGTTKIVAFTVIKDGYYPNYTEYHFYNLQNNRWLPWNPEVTLVMRKIENPVAMYARKAEIKIPEIGKEIGFDLMAYDWVEPYGKGKQADFVFKLEKRFVNEDDYDSKLIQTLPNKFNGIQLIKEDRRYGSLLKLPRFAPEHGYQKMVTKYSKRESRAKPIEDDFKEDNNYIFRIRSEEKDGKLIKAMYGKIHGDIRFYPRGKGTAGISFKYYLNPDYTRNLEFDPKQNLFKNLKSTEEVGLE